MFGMIIATHAVVKDDDLGWTEIVNAIDIPIIYKALGDEEDFIKDKDEYFEHTMASLLYVFLGGNSYDVHDKMILNILYK